MQLFVKRVSPNAVMPFYGSLSSAGIDLCACESVVIPPRTRAVIDTGLSFEWDDDTYYGRIAPRSGLSVKHSIDIGAGVIDFDYRGNIKICFINNGDNPYTVTSGDKIAQIVFEKVAKCVIKEVDVLGETERGSGGFGSTGK
jgi:deoxyuridine 5'-triphosphate nucleotidohydrolase